MLQILKGISSNVFHNSGSLHTLTYLDLAGLIGTRVHIVNFHSTWICSHTSSSMENRGLLAIFNFCTTLIQAKPELHCCSLFNKLEQYNSGFSQFHVVQKLKMANKPRFSILKKYGSKSRYCES